MPPLRKGVPGQIRHATQTLTASGGIAIFSGTIILSHATVIIAATIPTGFQVGDELLIVNNSASGTAAHTVTLPAGVFWESTSRIATLDAPNEAIVARCITPTRWFVKTNLGSVAFS